jgi:hypothetical protein
MVGLHVLASFGAQAASELRVAEKPFDGPRHFGRPARRH